MVGRDEVLWTKIEFDDNHDFFLSLSDKEGYKGKWELDTVEQRISLNFTFYNDAEMFEEPIMNASYEFHFDDSYLKMRISAHWGSDMVWFLSANKCPENEIEF